MIEHRGHFTLQYVEQGFSVAGIGNFIGNVTRPMANRESIVIHCLAGRGRAGTVASALLVACGREPAQAIADIRGARPGAIETAVQEIWVLAQMRPDR